MSAARLAQPAPSTVPAAGLPTAALRSLRQAWSYLWWSVRTHVADLHGWPRPPAWPRTML